MTSRIPLDDMTSDQLDHLYLELDTARRALNPDDLSLVDEMIATVEQHKTRADQAEATLARVRRTIDSVKAAQGGHVPTTDYDRGVARTVEWVTMRVLEAIDARLVSGTAPAPSTAPTPGPCPACRRADQAGLAPAEQHRDCTTQETR